MQIAIEVIEKKKKACAHLFARLGLSFVVARKALCLAMSNSRAKSLGSIKIDN